MNRMQLAVRFGILLAGMLFLTFGLAAFEIKWDDEGPITRFMIRLLGGLIAGGGLATVLNAVRVFRWFE